VRIWRWHKDHEPRIFEVSDDPQEKLENLEGLKNDGWVAQKELAQISPEKPTKTSLELIVEAIDKLDPDNPEHYTTTGIPRVDALESASGITISAKQRDKAFQKYWDAE